MVKVLSIDPSGTGTSGIFFAYGEQKEFYQCQKREWKEHYWFIKSLVEEKKVELVVYEDTNYIHRKTKDGLSLFRLLGGIECLGVKRIESVNVLRVKDLGKKLLSGREKIEGISYEVGRGKGWMFQNKRISLHQLEAYLVYWLFIRKN